MGNQNLVWSKKIEFVLTLMSFAIGLGNVWRFPYLCYSNGGGAFLLPYFLSLFLIGLPIFFLEISLGQFSGLNAIACWNIAPAFRGIGYSVILIPCVLGCYYNVIVSICLQYLYFSWSKTLPWTLCNQSWNLNCTKGNQAEQFFMNRVLDASSGIDHLGKPVSNMVGAYFFAWLLVFSCLSFSIKSLGKVSYVTAIFPYIMMTILIIRTALLPGSKEGISFYLKPNIKKIASAEVWKNAATQIFFSLSTCIGGIISLSSHNKFKNNAVQDAVLVAILNCATSFYVGFAVFAATGYLAHIQNKPVPEVVKSGMGLAFIAYPTGLAQLPVPQLWSTLFFIMMVLLGLGSMLSIAEGALTALENFLPDHSRIQNMMFRGAMCFLGFIIGLPMCFQGGNYLLDIADHGINIDFIWIGIFEAVAVMYVYGIKNYYQDMKFMLGKNLNYYWLITIGGTAPIGLIAILISIFSKFEYSEAAKTTPARVLNVFIVASPCVITLGYLIIYYLLIYFKKFKETCIWQPQSGNTDGYKSEIL